MADSTTKARLPFRPIGIVAAGTITYFITLLLVLYVLDRQFYNSQKLEIIREGFNSIVEFPQDQNTKRKLQYLAQHQRNVWRRRQRCSRR